MSEPRRRKHKQKSGDVKNGVRSNSNESDAVEPKKKKIAQHAAMETIKDILTWKTVNVVMGLLVCLYLGPKWALQMRELHENDMFFSNIKEVEREISFRTEAGLYYSYYKQLVEARTWTEGIHSLIADNITEHQRTINIIERFNIHQEVVLGTIYRLFPWKHLVEPIYFYMNTVFSLYGLYGMAMFLTAWLLCGSWLGGLLTMAFVFFNRSEVTRLYFTISLRESFAFPFIYMQLGLTTFYVRRTHKDLVRRLLFVSICVTTLAFVIAWQFAQFILLLQALALYTVQLVGIVPRHKIRSLFLIHVASLLSVFILQFGNPMVLQSLVLSFIVASLLVFAIQKDVAQGRDFFVHLLSAVGYSILTAVLAFFLNFLVKLLLNVEADEHIMNFVKSKLGLVDPRALRDFDVLLYVCNGAFIYLPSDIFMRMTGTLLLPTYLLVLIVCGLLMVLSVSQYWSRSSQLKDEDDNQQPVMYRRPDLSYFAVQTVFYGLMALTTRRFVFLWGPSMCILAGAGVCDTKIWDWLATTLRLPNTVGTYIRWAFVAFFIGILIYMCFPEMKESLEQLREFWDPDTVELMEWIKNSTAPTASFAGSMQLLAGVKLCTGRHITNHPHYENKWLRQRTLQVGQIYGRRTPKEIHEILKSIDANYIILEDSICIARVQKGQEGCRFPDLIDLSNGHRLEVSLGDDYDKDLKSTNVPRFCDEVRHRSGDYMRLFRLVMENRTFRVYEVT